MRSVYSIERVGEVQCLVDENQGRSLTNDIETVMQELTAAGTWQRGIPAHPDGYLTGTVVWPPYRRPSPVKKIRRTIDLKSDVMLRLQAALADIGALTTTPAEVCCALNRLLPDGLHLPYPVVHEWCRGHHIPEINTRLSHIAERLGVTAEWICFGDTPPDTRWPPFVQRLQVAFGHAGTPTPRLADLHRAINARLPAEYHYAKGSIWYWIKHGRVPKIDIARIERLAASLDVRLHWLLTGDDAPAPAPRAKWKLPSLNHRGFWWRAQRPPLFGMRLKLALTHAGFDRDGDAELAARFNAAMPHLRPAQQATPAEVAEWRTAAACNDQARLYDLAVWLQVPIRWLDDAVPVVHPSAPRSSRLRLVKSDAQA
ncbi:hypothetical protein B0G84_4373 [Paraburkholderia sp. BL8N3]|nr:hypothetical protein B0G84_4373 [Paraburkholderia sp. BL8N3]